jgi:hypothetical protein
MNSGSEVEDRSIDDCPDLVPEDDDIIPAHEDHNPEIILVDDEVETGVAQYLQDPSFGHCVPEVSSVEAGTTEPTRTFDTRLRAVVQYIFDRAQSGTRLSSIAPSFLLYFRNSSLDALFHHALIYLTPAVENVWGLSRKGPNGPSHPNTP